MEHKSLIITLSSIILIFILATTLWFILTYIIPPPIPFVTGVSENGVYKHPVVINIQSPEEHIMFTASIDGEPYALGSTYDKLGTHGLIITAIKERGGKTNSYSTKFTLDDDPPLIPTITGINSNEIAGAPASIILAKTEGGVTYSATLDSTPYELGNTITESGYHKLIVTATREWSKKDSILETSFVVDGPISFLDPVFEVAVRENIGKYDGEILFSDLKEIRVFKYIGNQSSGIQSISGIKNFRNLEELDLRTNKITEVGELGELEHLRKLLLTNNRIHDLSNLDSAHNLRELNLWNNRITDIRPITNLINLEILDISLNKDLENIESIGSLTKLEKLGAWGNNITDISSLLRLKKLKDINLSNNSIKDVAVLAELPELHTIRLSDNPITSILPLYNLRNIQFLWLERSSHLDISEGSEATQVIEKLRSDGAIVHTGT